jgi:hypothetical protein
MSTKSLAAVLTIGLVYAGPAWSGEIRETVKKFPSNLATPVGPRSNKVQKRTSIGCFDVRNGVPLTANPRAAEPSGKPLRSRQETPT